MYISSFTYIPMRKQEIFCNRFPCGWNLHFRPNDGSKPGIDDVRVPEILTLFVPEILAA